MTRNKEGTLGERHAIERCATVADEAAASAAKWLPNERAEAKVSIARAIAFGIRQLAERR